MKVRLLQTHSPAAAPAIGGQHHHSIMLQLHFINYVSKEFGILLLVINKVQQWFLVWHFTTLRPDASWLV